MFHRFFSSSFSRSASQKSALAGPKSRQTKGAKKRRRQISLILEQLEVRELLAADITGTVYEDVDRSGTRTNGENGVSGWTVFLDTNGDGTLQAGEPSAITNQDGDYTFRGLAPGNYRVTEVVREGWEATSAVSLDIVLADNTTARNVDFFNFSGGDITGTVWNDLDNDGERNVDPSTGEFTDPGLRGWTVFLDLNKNEAFDEGEPFTITDADGSYLFENLPPDDYEVTEVLPAGWSETKGYDWKQTAEVTARTTVVQDFGNFSETNGSIEGYVFNDLNGDGFRDIDSDTGEYSEPGLADWTVFIDLNDNQIMDDGDLETLTNVDGFYSFTGLDAGDYEVIEVLPDGWDVSPAHDVQQTVGVEGGRVTLADDFANFTTRNGSISGLVWNDVNRNGIRDIDTLTGAFLEPPIANWRVFLDLNRDSIMDASEPSQLTDVDGNYLFDDLQIGEYEVRQILPSGWEVAPTFGEDYTVRVFSGANSVAHDFANFNALISNPGSIQGTIWNDNNGNGLRDVGDVGVEGWTVFVDQNRDGMLTDGEPQVLSGADGSYAFTSITPGTVVIGVVPMTGWRASAPITGLRSVTLRSGQELAGIDFGQFRLKDSSISGRVYADKNENSALDAGESGIAGITVYLDLNDNGLVDADEPQLTTSEDLFYTPDVNEQGDYSFTHLAQGTYVVRTIMPERLSATLASELSRTITLSDVEDRTHVDFGAVYRASEIRGVQFEDFNANHLRDTDEPGLPGITMYLDLDRDDMFDADEPSTITGEDGSYVFHDVPPGAYVVREISSPEYEQTSPTTVGGDLWPSGVSNPAVGNVDPTSIEVSLAEDETYRRTVSITLPNTGALTDRVDVFLLFDDTGSFVNNSPIVRGAFPDIIANLQSALPGIDLGFGVGRFEEYANFASEYASGRPFVLNQPIVAATTAWFMSAIQAGLDRTTPGYGGDEPETDIEALYQLVTGKGFDGNNNGSLLDSGPAGLAASQTNPGSSGDVPPFASFVADPAQGVLGAAGNIGGGGFRAGALPIILLATDTGIAYQPKGEASITGIGGLNLPLSTLTETSRPTTPFGSGAGIQETITALNALGALVIGLGTNPEASFDPRQQLEAISRLTGATNQTTTTISNGTTDAIAPGDPLYFQIASGFAASVANGVVSAIQNAVTNVAVDIDVRASDPRVHLVNHSGIATAVGSGDTASFDVEFTGDGIPHRFDLQFVRAGTNVILGSIPVVLGTPVPGDGYEFDEIEDGEIEDDDYFGRHRRDVSIVNVAPSFVGGSDQLVLEDAGLVVVSNWGSDITAGPASESDQTLSFTVTTDNPELFASSPVVSVDGTLSFTPADNAFGIANVTVTLHDNGGTANGGVDTSAPQTFQITVQPVSDAPFANSDQYTVLEDDSLVVLAVDGVLVNDSDDDGDVLAAVLQSGPSHGSLLFNADGSFTYTPDAGFAGTDSFSYVSRDGSVDSNLALVMISVEPRPGDGELKFVVVDGARRKTCDYDDGGNDLGESRLDRENKKPRGIATTSDAQITWIIDANDEVFVYDRSGDMLGRYEVEGIDKPEGITTDGTHLWIVDRSSDRVLYFANGADHRSGNLMPTSSFRLVPGNRNPMDLVTDGTHLWVVNDAGQDSVFRYDLNGNLEGKWQIDPANSTPTGIAINPLAPSEIWVVDAAKKRIFQYDGAVSQISGSLNASLSMRLASQNSNPQGIADPKLPSPKLPMPTNTLEIAKENRRRREADWNAPNTVDQVYAELGSAKR
jgi:hypothetical protein